MNKSFHFSKIDHIEDLTFDQSLEKFREQKKEDGLDSEGTIREILQNAMDARNNQLTSPVKVKFKLSQINRNDIPGIDEIFEHIDHLEAGNSYNKDTVLHMKELKEKETISVLTASDSNTKGLTGADSLEEGTYAIYAYNKGVHGLDDDIMDEKIRGGSHGVGKIANNAASDIHLMFFANCDKEGQQHLGGSVQLFDHQINGQNYRGTGYYTDVDDNGQFKPYSNTQVHPVFQKQDRGLKIIIPYLRKELNNEEDIIKSVINNFFVSIIDKKLLVEVEKNGRKVLISDQTIWPIVKEYYPDLVEEMKKDVTPLYIQTYLSESPINFEVILPKKYDSQIFQFKLYFFDENENIPAGRTAIVRSMGMKIEDKKVASHATTPYNAILIGGPKEDEYLKTLENESHTALSYEAIRDPEEKRKAKKFLSTLNNNLREIIEENQSKKYETEGEIDTSDLIYQMNWAFDQDINKHSEKIEIDQEMQLTVDNQKEKRAKHQNHSKKSKSTTKTGRKRKARQKKQRGEENQENVSYILPSASVLRFFTDEEEYIQFNFEQVEDADSWESFHLSLRLVDGKGEESADFYPLTQLYSAAFDQNNQDDPLHMDQNKICNVKIHRGKANLRLKIKENYNAHLKFVYQLEVQR